MTLSSVRALFVLVLLLALPVDRGRGQPAAATPTCDETEAFHGLDFWVGEWDVRVGDRKVGAERDPGVAAGTSRGEAGGRAHIADGERGAATGVPIRKNRALSMGRE